MGRGMEAAVRDNYLSKRRARHRVHGSFYSYRDVYLDSTRPIATASAVR